MKTLDSRSIAATCFAAFLGAVTSAGGAVPIIVKPPQGASVLVGSSVNLAVEGTSSTPLSYQWLLNSAAIASQTGPTYSILNIQKASEGNYQVVLSNSSGSVTSIVARVSVVTNDIAGITEDLVGHYNQFYRLKKP